MYFKCLSTKHILGVGISKPTF